VLTLHLQPNVKFTNGKPFNAAAAIANLKYGQTPSNAMDSELTLAGCKFSSPNATTVVISMPTAEENSLLNSIVTLPMVDQSSNLNSDPIGTGPYMVTSFTPNVQLNLVRNPNYWNPAGRAKIKTVELKVFESAASEVEALQAGAINVLTYPPLNEVATLRSSGFGIDVSPGTGNEDFWASVKAKGSPFDNQDFRDALSWAFDRSLFVKLETDGLSKPTCDMWAITSPTFVQNLPDCGFNLSIARSYFKKSGYPSGTVIPLTTMALKWPELDNFLPIYKSDLAEIGIDLTITNVSPTAFGAFDNAIYTQDAPGLSPSFFGWGNVDPYFVSDYPFYDAHNLSSYSSSAYDSLAAKAVAEDEAGQTALADKSYKALAVLAAQEAFDINIATRPYVYAYSSNVKGVSVDIDGMADWASVSFK
jgi:peptide/nickel transport system substrate-binding protein